jgi:hypothetical protein
MTWLLILIAVNVNNPKDIPGKVFIEFSTERACIEALNTVEYEFKFKNFKIDAKCIKKS